MGLSPLFRAELKTATKDSFVAAEQADRILGFTPRYSNKDALLRNSEWYLANRSRLKKGAGTTHRSIWGQGVLGLAKYFF